MPIVKVVASQVLCAVLEFDICSNPDLKLQIVTTLQSTAVGRKAYGELSDRLTLLRELVCISSRRVACRCVVDISNIHVP